MFIVAEQTPSTRGALAKRFDQHRPILRLKVGGRVREPIFL